MVLVIVYCEATDRHWKHGTGVVWTTVHGCLAKGSALYPPCSNQPAFDNWNCCCWCCCVRYLIKNNPCSAKATRRWVSAQKGVAMWFVTEWLMLLCRALTFETYARLAFLVHKLKCNVLSLVACLAQKAAPSQMEMFSKLHYVWSVNANFTVTANAQKTENKPGRWWNLVSKHVCFLKYCIMASPRLFALWRHVNKANRVWFVILPLAIATRTI